MNEKKAGDISDYFSPVNTLLVLLNLLIFVFVDLAHGSENVEWMLRCGAMYWPDVIEKGEYYRLLTAMFLHFGVDHIFNNMLVLWFLGGTLEKLMGKNWWGKTKYFILYMLSGILAGLLAMGYNMFVSGETPVAAGASGAIFGVMGALLYVVIINRGKVKDFSPKQMLILVFLSLYSGFTSQGVDNAAHVGGFISGFLLAIFLYRKQKTDPDEGQTMEYTP